MRCGYLVFSVSLSLHLLCICLVCPFVLVTNAHILSYCTAVHTAVYILEMITVSWLPWWCYVIWEYTITIFKASRTDCTDSHFSHWSRARIVDFFWSRYRDKVHDDIAISSLLRIAPMTQVVCARTPSQHGTPGSGWLGWPHRTHRHSGC